MRKTTPTMTMTKRMRELAADRRVVAYRDGRGRGPRYEDANRGSADKARAERKNKKKCKEDHTEKDYLAHIMIEHQQRGGHPRGDVLAAVVVVAAHL